MSTETWGPCLVCHNQNVPNPCGCKEKIVAYFALLIRVEMRLAKEKSDTSQQDHINGKTFVTSMGPTTTGVAHD